MRRLVRAGPADECARITDMKLQYWAATFENETLETPMKSLSLTPLLAPLPIMATVLTLTACAGGRPDPRAEADEMRGPAYRQSAFLSGAALLFVQFDADGDYATSRAEAETGARAEWGRVSGGSDKLTPIQFDTWSAKVLGGPNLGPYRLAFDSNVNNEITATEFTSAVLAKFEFWDKDKDGRVTRGEMVERLPDMRRPPESGPQGMPPRGGQRPPR